MNYLPIIGFDDELKMSASDRIFHRAGYFEGPADDEITTYLETGEVDWDTLNKKLGNQEQYFKREEVRNALEEIFRKCYCNFIAQTDEMVAEMEKHCNDQAELIQPTSLESASYVLAQLGKPVDLQLWLTRWETANLPSMSDQDLNEITRGLAACPESVRIKARDEESKRRGKPTIHDTLTRRFSNETYSNLWIQEIADLPVADYEKWLATTDSEDVRSLVSSVFEDWYGKPASTGIIAEKTLHAVEMLGTKSVIHRFRAEQIKKSLPPPPPEAPK